jgi:ATP synthase protein I
VVRTGCYHPVALSSQAGAYFALFSEIGIFLLVTTLVGALAGYWVDKQLGTVPLFVLVGFLGGAGIGTVGIYRLITRFLARFN